MTAKKANILFVVLSYAFFWVLLICAVTFFSGNEELFSIAVAIVQVVGTWAPTAALLIMFRKLYPGMTIKEFYKNAFRERLNVKLLLVVTALFLLINWGMVGVVAFKDGVSFVSLLTYSFDGFLITLFSGAMGEESGWRGHLQPYLEKKHSLLKSLLILGLIWAFWHTLTWINYFMMGIPYMIPLDILSKVALAFIIGICYHHCRNLFVPVWIHFVANMVINGTQNTLINYYAWYILLEVLIAVGYIVWYLRTGKKKTSED
jgi:membrane protease YdiL (CAAX protease family)